MTTVSSINQVNGNVQVVQPPVPAAQTQTANTTTQAPVHATAQPTVASRQLSDPLSGAFITQYLNNSGDVASQTPSSAVVAYLRNGLTAQGFPRDGGTTA